MPRSSTLPDSSSSCSDPIWPNGCRQQQARLRRPATVVCVVGEFKQGKSSLVNALLGQAVCPVDDDLATSAITLVRYAAEASAGATPSAVASTIAPGGVDPDPRGGEMVSSRSPSTTSTSG